MVNSQFFFRGDSRWYEGLCAAVDEVLEKNFYCEYWTYRLMVGGVGAGLDLCGGEGHKRKLNQDDTEFGISQMARYLGSSSI